MATTRVGSCPLRARSIVPLATFDRAVVILLFLFLDIFLESLGHLADALGGALHLLLLPCLASGNSSLFCLLSLSILRFVTRCERILILILILTGAGRSFLLLIFASTLPTLGFLGVGLPRSQSGSSPMHLLSLLLFSISIFSFFFFLFGHLIQQIIFLLYPLFFHCGRLVSVDLRVIVLLIFKLLIASQSTRLI